MPRAYDRTRHYLQMGQFVKIMGYEGEKAFFKISLVDIMAQQTTLFGDGVQGVPANIHIGGVPSESDPDPVPFTFLEPIQELRLAQVRLTVYAVTRDEPAPPSGEPTDAIMAPIVEVQANSPESERRLGSDVRKEAVMNGLTPPIVPPPALIQGGRDGGRIGSNQIIITDDKNEVFDFWVMHGYEPAFSIANGSTSNLGAGGLGQANFYWYLTVQGRIYLLAKPSMREIEGLLKRKIPYKGITLGGISTVTMGA